ncbi:MAG: hypothetical protein Q8M44_00455 [bacterium]|nr:hypothetical protein [bacterium]
MYQSYARVLFITISSTVVPLELIILGIASIYVVLPVLTFSTFPL